MNVTRLRAIMQRYQEAGVLLVGAYLVGHHLWTKRRIALLTTKRSAYPANEGEEDAKQSRKSSVA